MQGPSSQSAAASRHQAARPSSIRRSAFTMIELLVVMSILGILSSLVLVAIGRATDNANRAATQALITKIDAVLRDRLDTLQRQDFTGKAINLKTYIDAANGVNIPYTIAELLVRKAAYRGQFPQCFRDLCGIDQFPGAGPYAPAGGSLGGGYGLWNDPTFFELLGTQDDADFAKRIRTAILDDLGVQRVDIDMSRHTTDTESAELLYQVVLEEGQLDTIESRFIKDTDEDGLPEFVDAWGTPLRFFNWPTRLLKPNGPIPQQNWPPYAPNVYTAVNPTDRAMAAILMGTLPPVDLIDPLEIDPVDIKGLLGRIVTTQFALPIPDAVPAASRVCQPFTEFDYHTPDTYSAYLIVSPGADRLLGLFEPAGQSADSRLRLGQIAQLSDITDNVTNRQVRGGTQ